jgi:serine/threonine protein phosphatase PrpC
MTAAWRVGAATDPGRERTRNEDAYAVQPLGDDRYALVVCDGMGGHQDGHIASRTAVETLQRRPPDLTQDRPFEALHTILTEADHAVHAVHAADAPPGEVVMGTTAVVAWLDGARLWYGWVGDSRLYLLRGGQIIERSVDHTRVQELVNAGELTAAEAADHPHAHVLSQVLGMGTARPSVYAEAITTALGDRLLLCSDGLHDLVEDHELADLLAGEDPAATADALVALANARGGHDNITVVVAARVAPAAVSKVAARVTQTELAAPTVASASSAAPSTSPGWSTATVVAIGAAMLVVGLAVGAWWASSEATPQVVPEGSTP